MSLSGLFVFFYMVAVIGVIVFLLTMISRFVRAHERVADSLATIASKSKDGTGV